MPPKNQTNTIVFEQPLNEHLRIFLRLEQLFTQLDAYLQEPSINNAQLALITLLRLVDVIDRPDIKSKLMQTLTQYATTLGQLERFPQVDVERLHSILTRLDELIHQMHHIYGRIGEGLRANDFLNQLRPQLAHPGGIFLHHAPAFALWLKQSAELRSQELVQWATELRPLPEITRLVLDITRNSTLPQSISSDNGFYLASLDATLSCQMVRVELPAAAGVYAEISAGKHRLSIRFVKPNYLTGERPKQISDPITFLLTCCRF